MLRLRVAELLQARGKTAYWLSQATGLGRTAYRYAEPGAIVERITASNLGAICEALECQPGDILVWEPARKREKTKPRR